MDSDVGGVNWVGCVVVCQFGGGEVESQTIRAGSEVNQSLEV
jgi:hypothetical protein